MLATVCHRHQVIIPQGAKCTACERDRGARNAAANVRLGRTSLHWRRLSASQRARAHGICPVCGGRENTADPGSRLSVDLIGGGDHSRARPEQTAVKCARCHGHADGGRRVA